MSEVLSSPYIYFGGKSSIASEVWARLGDVQSYIEPFFGSGAVLLARPGESWGTETVNDIDGMISNFWRAIAADPELVAKWADWPVNENDLHARHAWLIGQKTSLQEALEGNPDYYDAKIAGWWCWSICAWIGSGFCSGKGPWHVVDGKLVKENKPVEGGIWHQLIHLRDDGQGINRNLIHLGDDGRGINRKRIHLGNGFTDGCGINKSSAGNLVDWFNRLQHRLRRVRVCCGDWKRICGPTPLGLDRFKTIGVFLDPPYGADQGRDMGLYSCDSGTVAGEVREWAVEMGKNPKLRIALCGYEGIEMPPDWQTLEWKAQGGYDRQGDGTNQNRHRERIYFSPACIKAEQRRLI